MARTRIADEDSNYEELVALARKAYLDKSEHPIWQQIYDRLAAACRERALVPGSRLPGEYRLAEIFGVNRITMRNALGRLQEEGLLQARKGAGIFVRAPAQRYVIKDNMRFSMSLDASGTVTTRTVSLHRRKASAWAREAYGLAAGAETVELHRVRLLDGNPIYYAVKEFSPQIFPRLEVDYAEHGSVTRVYRDHGVTSFRRAETRVSGGFADAMQSEGLTLTPMTPVILVESHNTDEDGRTIELNRGCWPLTSVELVFSTP